MILSLSIKGMRYNLKEGETVVGRDSACDIIIHDPSVSRRHAMIICGAAECTIEDLGSYHGLRLNGEVLRGRTPIYRNDIIQITGTDLEIISGPPRPAADAGADAEAEEAAPSARRGVVRRAAAEKPKSRLKSPLYLGLMVVGVILVLAVAVLALLPEKPARPKKLVTQQDVMTLTKEYLDRTPALSVDGLTEEQIAAQARELFLNAEEKFKLRDIKSGQAFAAFANYRKALELLNRITQRPDYYDRLLHHMGESRQWVEANIAKRMQEGWVAKKGERWQDAYDAYEAITVIVPEKDFPVAVEAKKQMQSIAPQLAKQKGKKK